MNRHGPRKRIRAWGRRQLYSFFSSLGSLLEHRLGTLMTVLVLGVAMVLPLGLYVVVNNLSALDIQQDRWGQITVFLDSTADDNVAGELAEQVRSRHGASVETVSPDEGLATFREASGFGDALELFEQNPLPWVLLVTPEQDGESGLEEAVTSVAGWLEQQDVVESVQVDYKWLKRLSGWLALAEALVTVLALVLSLAVVVVVANTIRLDVSNRADEIQVLNMVGAPDGFIRQPFLYSGFWYGVMGAVMALGLLQAALLYLSEPLESLLGAYGTSFEVRGAGTGTGAAFLLMGGLLGFLGSWLAVRRYLRQFRLGEMPQRR